MYFNCCCSCWFEPEPIKLGQASHKMYSNNMVNFPESTTILNAWTKNVSSCKATYTKTIKVRRTRHAVYCWRRKDKLINDTLLWTPSHGRAKVGRPARTYLQPIYLCRYRMWPGGPVRSDRDGWQERVREIHANCATWWLVCEWMLQRDWRSNSLTTRRKSNTLAITLRSLQMVSSY